MSEEEFHTLCWWHMDYIRDEAMKSVPAGQGVACRQLQAQEGWLRHLGQVSVEVIRQRKFSCQLGVAKSKGKVWNKFEQFTILKWGRNIPQHIVLISVKT